MELLYFHDKNSNLPPVCFSNELNIYEKDEILYFEVKENYLEDFFSNNISNLTAIVGENGSGKSRILNRIMDLIGLEKNTDIVAVIKNTNTKGKIIEVFGKVTCQQKRIGNYKITSKGTLSSFSWEDISPDTTFIYFSNKFDGKEIYQINNSFNISTEALLVSDFEKFTNNDKSKYNSQITIHSSLEIIRQLRFINAYQNNPEITIPFELPKYLKIRIVNTDQDEFKKEVSRTLPQKFNNEGFLMNVIDNIYEVTNSLNSNWYKRNLQREMLINFIRNYLISLVSLNYSKFPIERILLIIQKHLLEAETVIDFKALSNAIKDELKYKDGYSDVADKFTDYTFFYYYYEEFIDNPPLPIFDGLYINTNRDKLSNLISLYTSAVSTQHYLLIDWQPSFSSGQRALLSQYGRFYDVYTNDKFNSKNDVIILVDETNLYYHPKWEQEFLMNFINFTSGLFKLKNPPPNTRQNIQIILTTHSPIILSDIPNNCIAYLGDENILINNTFASNIYNLYKESFFMKKGLMGDFAITKLNELKINIEKVKKGTIERNTITRKINNILDLDEKIQKTINIIGEPLLRRRFQDLFDDYKDESELIAKQNKILLEKIAQLEAENKKLKKNESN